LKIEEIIKNSNLSEANVFYNEPMARHTSFKIGGLAECYIKINNIEELQEILKISKTHKIPLTIIGNGTNILVLDEGIQGIIAKINIKNIQIDSSNLSVIVGAGNTLAETAQILMKHNLAGFEELSGIPGTIGGAIRMNAGAHGKEIKDVILNATVIDYEGNIQKFTNQEMQFEYRNSIFSKEKYIILEAELQLEEGKQDEINEKMKGFATWRKEHQPLEYPNAGSTFKRGEGFITAGLIDQCGLKGYTVGGAQISTKHAGFIINTGNAKAKDVLELVEITKREVFKKFEKEIKLEIEIIGDTRRNKK